MAAADPLVRKPPGRTFSEGLLGQVGGLARKDHGKAFPVEKTDAEGSVNVARDGSVRRNPQISEKTQTERGAVHTRPSGPLEESGDLSLVQGSMLGLFRGRTLGPTHRPQLSGTCRLPRSAESPASDLLRKREGTAGDPAL